MAESTASDIEKENLEAHVELCAERYKTMDDKLENIQEQVNAQHNEISVVKDLLHEIKDALFAENQKLHTRVTNISENRYKQLIKWGIMAIFLLAGALGSVIFYLIKSGMN